MAKNKNICCDLCGCAENKFLFDGKDLLHGKEGTFSYVMCIRCGLVYMNPQISANDIGKFYPDDYAPHLPKSAESKQDSPVIRLKIEKNHFKSIWTSLNKQSRLLDIGCGNGRFLYEVQSFVGCEVHGIDISQIAVDAAKENYGLDIFKGTITGAPFLNNYFDVITAWSYLEHVNNPSEVLRKIYNMLKPGGDCVISCPNFDSFNAKIFKDKWYHLDCPRHLYIYTPKTITKLMVENRFVVKKVIYEKSSKGFLGSLQYYFYGNNFDLEYRNKIRRSSLAKAIVSPLTRIAALFKKADTIVIHAKKE